MRFFKSTRTARPAANAVAVERLNSVVGRGKAELYSYPSFGEPPEPERAQRRFWTPAELATESSGE